MADGTKKQIDELRVGDRVLAGDPITGDRPGRRVERVWVHDDTLLDLKVGSGVVTTTEDHPFWNATDRKWEEISAFALGDEVLTADGHRIEVEGFRTGSARAGLAYNLTVAESHTYFVGAGADSVLVHNTGDDCRFTERQLKEAEQALQRTKDFRRWFHREYKGDVGQGQGNRTNPDLGRDSVHDAYEEWDGLGRPGG